MKRLVVISLIISLVSFSVAGTASGSGIGYWKKHIAERDSFISDAVLSSIDTLDVFATEDDLLSSLNSKGNKDMEIKAKQHLAALLLSIASGRIDRLAKLSNSERAILQTISSIFDKDATVGEAVVKIEDAIKTGVNLEGAKDLSVELNKR